MPRPVNLHDYICIYVSMYVCIYDKLISLGGNFDTADQDNDGKRGSGMGPHLPCESSHTNIHIPLQKKRGEMVNLLFQTMKCRVEAMSSG